MNTRDAKVNEKGVWFCFIDEDDLQVEGQGSEPRLAIQAAEAAFANAKMLRRAGATAKVDPLAGVLLETS